MITENKKRLAICFTIFGLFDADENSPYYDIDKWMKEVKERGFNCIRLDCGAGFTHDINGNLRGEITLTNSFGNYGKIIRQTPIFITIIRILCGNYISMPKKNANILREISLSMT